ncbi:LUD domain-containing protein [Blastopirellula sp. JC732]|uniref:LUD domain-containing protein n=1 Tax=Blastopirellula sediminis TaxID=2894196 RepID=A0A9X1MKS8_9BACT|nr:LUD domain-containing protein [Blastopirellula sediminis]MCC9608684.1 LUD domain-containing protein [Blastopirellula sediminis]MCC9628539.1 LUD domain-containing protein [Blastopirellula sediminis]
MSSRDQILKSIRNQIVAAVDHPGLAGDWIRYDDRVAHFSSVLAAVGGVAHVVDSSEQILAQLKQVPAFAAGKKIVSLCAEVAGNVDFAAVEDPHQLEDVDFAVLPAQFAVAENGAVWVDDADVKHRVIYFIPQHLSFIVPAPANAADAIVDNMHQAYERLSFGEPRFGAFISGPSKTADIEQSLVIGAHGARSLNVFFLRQ